MDALVRMRGLEPTIVHIKSMLFYQLNYILILNLSVQVVKRLSALPRESSAKNSYTILFMYATGWGTECRPLVVGVKDLYSTVKLFPNEIQGLV